MNLMHELAALTDGEAERCLNGILKGLAVTQPDFGQVLGSSEEMSKLLAESSAQAGLQSSRFKAPPDAARI